MMIIKKNFNSNFIFSTLDINLDLLDNIEKYSDKIKYEVYPLLVADNISKITDN
jgi:hypothetical protein